MVASDADGSYGTRASDKEISLGRVDVYRLQQFMTQRTQVQMRLHHL